MTTFINGFPFVSYQANILSAEARSAEAQRLRTCLYARRSVREFSQEPIADDVIENLLWIASSAPSGANKQPYTFCVVRNADLKRQIREAAEREEYESYQHRMSEEWLNDIKPLQTDWHKPFLEQAPVLVVVFKKVYDLRPDGARSSHYYVNESVGLACGFFLSALHQVGLAALTHTPSPMNFLTTLLKRPAHERPFLLIPVGFPAPDTLVPVLPRKSLADFSELY